MDFEPIGPEEGDEFEIELRQAFERRPAPPGMKARLMARRRFTKAQQPLAGWYRIAASLLIVALLAGGVAWRNREQRRKEDEARRQVLTALRITSRALNQMNARLAAHGRPDQD